MGNKSKKKAKKSLPKTEGGRRKEERERKNYRESAQR